MQNLEILEGKKILIVDDEPDVMETLRDLLSMCDIDSAPDYETAEKFLKEKQYDIAIFDIMGVRGYDLLAIANQQGTPALMFTAHALNTDAFVESMEGGAKAYIPKEKMSEIATYVADLLTDLDAGIHKPRSWFDRLESFFEKQFGHEWLEKYEASRKKYDWLYRKNE